MSERREVAGAQRSEMGGRGENRRAPTSGPCNGPCEGRSYPNVVAQKRTPRLGQVSFVPVIASRGLAQSMGWSSGQHAVGARLCLYPSLISFVSIHLSMCGRGSGCAAPCASSKLVARASTVLDYAH